MVTKLPHPTHWARHVPKAVALLAGARGRPRRLTVSGDSMLPTFRPGDRVVVVPTRSVAPGHIVAVADPTAPARMLIKRVQGVAPAGLDVRGDNEDASTDSRTFGPVPMAAVIGRVVYQYHPSERAAWLA